MPPIHAPGALLAALALLGPWPVDWPTTAPVAKVATDPVPVDGDAADDPAIWVHPTDPSRSLVLGTNKKGGLHVYGLDGAERQVVSPRSLPNNVDLLYGFRLGRRSVDLAVAGLRGDKGKDNAGVKAWAIDPDAGTLAELGPGVSFATFGGVEAYGLCTYRSPRDGASYVFVTDHGGKLEQYRLDGTADGPPRGTLARSIVVGSQSEGIVADRETGRLYVGEEDIGIWEYGAEPGDGNARTPVAKVGEHGLAADVEGLTIYYAPGGLGYLLASSQGSDTIHAYDRKPPHAHVLTIDPAAGPRGDVAETDGIDVTNEPLGPAFPRGLLVVQDGTKGRRQSFKLFAWEDVAGNRLRVDTTARARQGIRKD